MTPVKYYFNQLPFVRNGNYLLQIVRNRKLSSVYHFHDFYEILLVLRGETSHVVNMQDYEMKPGECMILRPGDCHMFTSQSEELELLGLSITENEFQRFFNSFTAEAFEKTATLVFSCLSRLAEIRDLSYNNYYQSDAVFNQKLLLCTILNCYCTGSGNVDNPIPEVLQNAVNEMHNLENMKEGMAAMMRLTNYSRSHLCRLMKKYYLQSPHDFINDLRMKTAYNMTVFSDLPIEEISESVGYNSISHFNIIFKKEYGMSPAVLRKSSHSCQSF